MNRKQLEIDGEIYWFKIGLRGIIYLQSLPEYTEEDVFVAGLITLQDISISKAKSLFRRQDNDKLIDMQAFISPPFFTIDVRDLYSKAVGELGISPAIFFQMTPEEIDLAYNGYLQRQELSANLMLAAVDKALSYDVTPIELIETPEYKIGNMQERQYIFEQLGCE